MLRTLQSAWDLIVTLFWKYVIIYSVNSSEEAKLKQLKQLEFIDDRSID